VSQKSGHSKPANKPAAPAKEAAQDVVLIRGVSESGEMAVLRARDNKIEAGLVKPVAEGEALSGEIVKLKPREQFPLLCDVEVQVPAGTVNATGGSDAARSLKGPAQVATKAYRDNWDSIWPRTRSASGKKPN
jgi:hypothetical protein